MTSAATPKGDPHRVHRVAAEAATGGGTGGPASKRIVTAYGFWIFLLSDIIMFSGFFATYAVLSGATAGGPTTRDLFDVANTATETGCLLASSFACGIASIAVRHRNMAWVQGALLVTGVLGGLFLLLEVREFGELILRGAGPTRSAFLSSFFALVGCHGLHIAVGLLWLGTMMAQFWAKGFREDIERRFICFALFWHALDVVWIAIFTNVYLIGTI